MKSLTGLWGEFRNIDFDRSDFTIVSRLFLEKLEDPDGKDSPLFVAINTLSGAVDILEYEEGRLLEALIHGSCTDRGPNSVPGGFLDKLRDRGYIFPSREIEELFFESVLNHYKHLSFKSNRILGFFSIDTECPMKCEYCFEKKGEEPFEGSEKSIMTPASMEAAFRALDLLRGLQEKEVEFVAGWGGEPLQEKNYSLNERFVALARQRALPIVYFSNMAMMGKRLFALLEENTPYIKFISTTLDGLQQRHDGLRSISGSFQRTVSSINACLRMGLSVAVRTNVAPYNIDFIPELAAFYESQGWFGFPGFTSFVTPAHDRQHDGEKSGTLSEDEAMSRWLRLRDEFPLVRQMKTLKYAPSLSHIMKAFEPNEVVDIRANGSETDAKPMLTHCAAENRTEYVFTGAPNHSIYICAECTGLTKFRIGRYLPTVSFDPEKKRMWGIQDDFHAVRSIDRLPECKSCRAATLCGGYCALEAIVENGCADKVFCKNVPGAVPNFIARESARFYRRSKALLNVTHQNGDITLD